MLLISILSYLLQIICIVLGSLVIILSVLLTLTTLWKQYISGYCRRRLAALVGVIIGGVIMISPIALFDIKGFLFLTGLLILLMLIGLAYHYIVICPPHKRKA